MLRERFKEMVDFATTESPYRQATKGWITDDLYLEWSRGNSKPANSGEEVAEVSIYWKPINEIFFRLFFIVVLASLFVFTSVSLSRGVIKIPQVSIEVQPQEPSLEVTIDKSSIATSPKEVPSLISPVDKAFPVDADNDLNSQSNSYQSKPMKGTLNAQEMFQSKRG